MPSLLTRGLGVSPYGLVTRGLGVASLFTPSAPYRDRQILYFIADAIRDIRQFNDVRTDGRPDRAGADAGAVASLTIGVAKEVDSLGSNADGSVTQVRTVPLTVVIQVRKEDPDVREDELDRLAQAVLNVVNGRSFGGVTMPTGTWLREGEAGAGGGGVTGQKTLKGQFVYLIDSWGTRNEDG